MQMPVLHLAELECGEQIPGLHPLQWSVQHPDLYSLDDIVSRSEGVSLLQDYLWHAEQYRVVNRENRLKDLVAEISVEPWNHGTN